MRKWIIYLIAVLSVGIVAAALEDCRGTMTPSDIPCIVKNSYSYANNCTTYEVKIYNNTPALIHTRNMTTYGVTGLCNITFNYSSVGSYFLNISSGDTATIVVEVDENLNIAIVIGLSVFAVIFILLGIFLYLKFKE